MRLALCSWSLGCATPAELVTRIREVGLPRVQLRLDDVLSDPVWAEAPVVLLNAGIEIVSGMMQTRGEDYTTLASIRRTGGLVPDAHWAHNRDLAARVAHLAATLGLPLVSLHAGFLPHGAGELTNRPLTCRTREVADRFAALGIDLLLETGQEDAATLLRFLKAVDRPNLFVNFDPANMLLYGMGDPLEALAALLPHVKQVHLKDALPATTPGTWGREVPVGQGCVDWPCFFETLKAAGFRGEHVLEREAGADRVADLRDGLGHVHALCGYAAPGLTR